MDTMTIATIFSAIAAAASAYSAYRAPIAAALLAEKLRTASEQNNETRRLKLWIFTTLMQERRSLGSEESVKVLNLIDVVYSKSDAVRQAWASLLDGLAPGQPPHYQSERLGVLLKEMASDLGLSSDIRYDDIQRVYYPDRKVQEDLIRFHETRHRLAAFQGQKDPAQDIGGPQDQKWPPRPSALAIAGPK